MRTLVRQVLIDDATLAGLGLVDNAVVSGDADSVVERPFVNLQWAETTPGIGPVNRRNLVIWVHDDPSDYTRIDSVVRRIRTVLTGLNPDDHASGWLLQAEWITDSSDLRNDERGTILRTSTYRIVGSGM